MKTIIRSACAGILACAISSLPAAKAAPPPVEAFGSLPDFGDASLSPDGKHIAIIRPVKAGTGVFIYDTENLATPPHAFGIDGAVAEYTVWPNNERLLCSFRKNLKRVYSKAINEWTRVVSMKADTSDPVVLLHDEPMMKYNFANAIVDMPPETPNHVYMTGWGTNAMMHNDAALVYDEWHLNLYRVNIENGLAELVLHGTTNEVQILMDGHGHAFGRVDQDSSLRNHIFIGNNEVGVFDARGGRTMEFAGITSGANPQLAVRLPSSSGTTGLFAWQLPNGAGEPLFADKDYDIAGVIADDRGAHITGVRYADDRMRTHYFDPALQKIQNQLEAALPGQSVSILSQDGAGTSYAVRADGPQSPPTLAIFRPATHQLSIILDAYPNLQRSDLGEMKPYPYKARDGLDIHAYLTLPPGKDPHNLPTVIMPHGGPEDRDMLRFDWVAQFLASRGYAVLQPNFRGSSGYGWPFIKAGDGEWAGKVQYDVQDGVKKLIAEGISDPKRTCIFGWSYGGYMALAGATFSPDLYVCAAGFAGMYDLDRNFYSGSKFESEVESLWERRMGASRSDTSKMDSLSPALHADQVKIPVLLMHSDKDVTVPIEQSKREAAALKSAGKSVEFITMDGDDHYLSYAETRIRMLNELEKFLKAHIGQ